MREVRRGAESGDREVRNGKESLYDKEGKRARKQESERAGWARSGRFTWT